MDLGIPSLVPEWRKMFSSETLVLDVAAGLTVGCIAVPLSLAIAVASGVPAEVGLVSAAVAGVAGGMLGGTTLAITGPAAAISLLVCEAVQTHGLSALPFITLCCGALQLLTGISRGGVVTKFVPASVISGFTTGIGMMILTGQLPKALGLTVPGGLNTLEIFQAVGERVSDINPAALTLALGTSGAMLLLPKLHPKIPSALLAVGGATAAATALGLNVAKIGALPSGMAAFQLSALVLPPIESLPALCSTIALIYAMTSVETLLSCSALDKMRPTVYKYNADQELIGQGVANMASAAFMGMPVTAVIARSSLNVKLKANTRLPSLVQAGFVFSSVAFFSDYMATVPMAALSGVLITSGISMLNPPELKHCLSVDRRDMLPYLATTAGMLTVGMAEGIGLGCVTAGAMALVPLLSAARMRFRPVVFAPDATERLHLTDKHGQQLQIEPATPLWQLAGPLNFLSMLSIDELAGQIEKREGDVIVDMQHVESVEFTGGEELINRLIEAAGDRKVHLVNCSEQLEAALNECDLHNKTIIYATLK